jgi:hypothetical protein
MSDIPYYRSAQVPAHLDPLGPKNWSGWEEELPLEEEREEDEEEEEKEDPVEQIRRALNAAQGMIADHAWSQWDEPMAPEERDALRAQLQQAADTVQQVRTMPGAIELAVKVALRAADEQYDTWAAKLTAAERTVWPREAALIPIPRAIVLALLHLYGSSAAP